MSYKHKKEVQLMHHFYVFDLCLLHFQRQSGFHFFFLFFILLLYVDHLKQLKTKQGNTR